MLKILPFGHKRNSARGSSAYGSGDRGTALAVAQHSPEEYGADGWLTVHHIQKSYKKRLVVRGVTLAVGRGESVGLLGPNGAGKTTLVKLPAGLYPLKEGSILIGDADVATMDRGELRQRIGVIFQDFVHYHFSAAENVGLGWLPSLHDRDAVLRASESAGADEVIQKLPKKYDTPLGRWFGGEQLSIGQWQRVALARAFMRKSKVLILDEPTASIDAEAEHAIFERFEALKDDSTSILITHRFGSVKMADRIVVL